DSGLDRGYNHQRLGTSVKKERKQAENRRIIMKIDEA
ncbi:unnamed protein product, partial [Allacma fusca]